MIDEKKLIEKISRMRENAALYRRDISQICENLLCELNDFITELPKVGEWIPVSERLPDNDDMMMVTCRTKAGRSSVNRAYCDDKGFWHGSGSMSGVVAWMPLPEPWEGEK